MATAGSPQTGGDKGIEGGDRWVEEEKDASGDGGNGRGSGRAEEEGSKDGEGGDDDGEDEAFVMVSKEDGCYVGEGRSTSGYFSFELLNCKMNCRNFN